MIPIRFPALRTVLWDHTELSEGILVGPNVCVPQTLKIRKAVLKSLMERGKRTSLLFGKAIPTPMLAHTNDEIVMCGGEYSLEFDGFDLGDGNPLPRPSDMSIQVRQSRPFHTKSMTDPKLAIANALESWFACKSNTLRPTSLIKFYGFVSRHNQSVRFTVEAYVPGLYFEFRRVPTLPFLQTPLLKRLRESTEDTQQEQNPLFHYGLLTLNETRKAVLLLEDDPLAYSMPLIGVWFKSPSFLYSNPQQQHFSPNADLNNVLRIALQDPVIYSGCVRYAANHRIKERVSPTDSPRTFLVCFIDFAPDSTPIFAECTVSSVEQNREMELFAATAECDFMESNSSSVEEDALICAFTHPTDIQDRLDFQTLVQTSIAEENVFKTDWVKSTEQAASGKPSSFATNTIAAIQRMNREAALQRSAEQWFEEQQQPIVSEDKSLAALITKQQQEIAEIKRVLAEIEDKQRALNTPAKKEQQQQDATPQSPSPMQTVSEEAEIQAIEQKYLRLL